VQCFDHTYAHKDNSRGGRELQFKLSANDVRLLSNSNAFTGESTLIIINLLFLFFVFNEMA